MKNIKINGSIYNDVETINVKDTNNNLVQFIDTDNDSSTTGVESASSDNIEVGYGAFVNGVFVEGNREIPSIPEYGYYYIGSSGPSDFNELSGLSYSESGIYYFNGVYEFSEINLEDGVYYYNGTDFENLDVPDDEPAVYGFMQGSQFIHYDITLGSCYRFYDTGSNPPGVSLIELPETAGCYYFDDGNYSLTDLELETDTAYYYSGGSDFYKVDFPSTDGYYEYRDGTFENAEITGPGQYHIWASGGAADFIPEGYYLTGGSNFPTELVGIAQNEPGNYYFDGEYTFTPAEIPDLPASSGYYSFDSSDDSFTQLVGLNGTGYYSFDGEDTFTPATVPELPATAGVYFFDSSDDSFTDLEVQLGVGGGYYIYVSEGYSECQPLPGGWIEVGSNGVVELEGLTGAGPYYYDGVQTATMADTSLSNYFYYNSYDNRLDTLEETVEPGYYHLWASGSSGYEFESMYDGMYILSTAQGEQEADQISDGWFAVGSWNPFELASEKLYYTGRSVDTIDGVSYETNCIWSCDENGNATIHDDMNVGDEQTITLGNGEQYKLTRIS